MANSAAYLECDCGKLVQVSQRIKTSRSICPACTKQYILEGGKFIQVDLYPDCQAPLKFSNGNMANFTDARIFLLVTLREDCPDTMT